MSTWYYYDNDGCKQGPVSGGQLKGLAKAGMITPETMVETEEGKTAPARKVKGLTFGGAIQSQTSPVIESDPFTAFVSEVKQTPPSPPVNDVRNSSSNYFFIDSDGIRQGPLTPVRLQTLADRGIITPTTPLETDTGHTGLAGQIHSLKFNVAVLPQPTVANGSSRSSWQVTVIGIALILVVGGIAWKIISGSTPVKRRYTPMVTSETLEYEKTKRRSDEIDRLRDEIRRNEEAMKNGTISPDEALRRLEQIQRQLDRL